jgi:N-acetylmuramic acid 6-phosphate etherase
MGGGQYQLVVTWLEWYYTGRVDTRVEAVTEGRIEEHADLDLRPTQELVELLNDEDAKVAAAVRGAAAQLAEAIDAIVSRLERGGRLVYVGAGSSGRLAQVDAAECGPTFGLGPGRVVAIVAGGPEALAEAQEEADDDVEAGEADLAAAGVRADDAVVAISASGSTPYTLGAARAASSAGALTVGVVCAQRSELGRVVEHEVVAVVGPEVIAGSTRLKAGTAQKLILNTISTVTMVRLGKTFGNLMVDVVAGNTKLRARAARAVALATDASPGEAEGALEAADDDAKVAIVSLLLDVSADDARRRLAAAAGHVRRALEEQ